MYGHRQQYSRPVGTVAYPNTGKGGWQGQAGWKQGPQSGYGQPYGQSSYGQPAYAQSYAQQQHYQPYPQPRQMHIQPTIPRRGRYPGGGVPPSHAPQSAHPYTGKFGKAKLSLVDVMSRMRHRKYIHPDLMEVIVHWAEKQGPAVPVTATNTVFEIKEDETVEAPEQEETELLVKVLPVRVSGQPGSHWGARITVLLYQLGQTQGGGNLALMGGYWKSDDGKDTSSPTVWAKTALRTLAAAGTKLPENTTFTTLAEAKFEVEGKTTRTVFLVPELWTSEEAVKVTACSLGSSPKDDMDTDEAKAMAPKQVITHKPHVATINTLRYTGDGSYTTTAFEVSLCIDTLWESLERHAVEKVWGAIKRRQEETAKEAAQREQREKATADYRTERAAAEAKAKEEWQEETQDKTEDEKSEYLKEKENGLKEEWDNKWAELQSSFSEAGKEPKPKSIDKYLTSCFSFLDTIALAPHQQLRFDSIRTALRNYGLNLSKKEEESLAPFLHVQDHVAYYSDIVNVADEDKCEQEPEAVERDQEMKDVAKEEKTEEDEAKEPADEKVEEENEEAKGEEEEAAAMDEDQREEEGGEEEEGKGGAEESRDLTKEQVEEMSYKELQAACKEQGLKASGKAEELRARLLAQLE